MAKVSQRQRGIIQRPAGEVDLNFFEVTIARNHARMSDLSAQSGRLRSPKILVQIEVDTACRNQREIPRFLSAPPVLEAKIAAAQAEVA
jgi:hypothetical protein